MNMYIQFLFYSSFALFLPSRFPHFLLFIPFVTSSPLPLSQGCAVLISLCYCIRSRVRRSKTRASMVSIYGYPSIPRLTFLTQLETSTLCMGCVPVCGCLLRVLAEMISRLVFRSFYTPTLTIFARIVSEDPLAHHSMVSPLSMVSCAVANHPKVPDSHDPAVERVTLCFDSCYLPHDYFHP